MPELPAAKRHMFATYPEQLLHMRKNLLLFARSPGWRERIVRVTGPPPGKIAPVVRVASSRHSNFIAVVQLRDAAHSQRQPKRQFQLCCRAAFRAGEPRYVVIRKERHQQ